MCVSVCVCVCHIYKEPGKTLAYSAGNPSERPPPNDRKTIVRHFLLIYNFFFSFFPSFFLSLSLSIYLSISLLTFKKLEQTKIQQEKKIVFILNTEELKKKKKKKKKKRINTGWRHENSYVTNWENQSGHSPEEKEELNKKKEASGFYVDEKRTIGINNLFGVYSLSLFFYAIFFRSLSLSLLDLHTYTYSMIAPLSGWLLFDCSYELSTGKSAQNTCGVHLFIRAFSFIIVIFFFATITFDFNAP